MYSVSCIIVSYNNGEYLSVAIESVLNQTRMAEEIIIADDASTDDSQKIISSYSSKYSFIRPIFRDFNHGVSRNRDLAIRAATGDLIVTLDGDDWYYPGKIAAELACFNYSDVNIAYSDLSITNDSGKLIDKWNYAQFPGDNSEARLGWIAQREGFIPTHFMMKKKAYLDSGGLDHSYYMYEDWDLKIRLAALPGSWAYTGVLGAAYRRTGCGLSSSNFTRDALTQVRVISKNNRLLFHRLNTKSYLIVIGRLIKRILALVFYRSTKRYR